MFGIDLPDSARSRLRRQSRFVVDHALDERWHWRCVG
jgi:hypothetical protein